jgi:putative SbcD/Mre11-related phosphoesterase
VLDGDLKYSFGKMARQEWDELEKFVDAVKGLGEVVAVKGNHDFYLQSMLHGAEITDILEQGRYVITHGNLKIRPRKGKLMIIGNEHPTVKIRDELGALHEYPAYIFCKKEGVLVIPAFNPLTRGANILGNRRWLSPVLAECDVENAEIYAIADDEVVPLGRLKRLEAAARQLI